MAEAKDKNETFKNILLELMVSNETLDKINTNTLNASEMGLEAAVSLESLVANQASGGLGGPALNEGVIAVLNLIAEDTRKSVAALNAISQVMSDTFDLNKSEALKNEEDRREDGRRARAVQVPADATKTPKMESSFGIMGTIAAIAGLVIGFVAGIVSALTSAFAYVMTAIGKFLKLDVLLAKIGLSSAKIAEFFKPLTDGFKKISTSISEAFTFVKTAISESSLVKNIKKFFEPLKDLFAFFSKEGSIISRITSLGGRVSSFFTKLTEIFGLFFRVGKVFGKLLGFVGIAISVFESISKAFKVFEETGDVGAAIEAGVVGFINAFTGEILDLLKDAISWIAGALGFKDVEKFLDSFSFTDIIAEFFHRFIKAGREMFEQYFQNFVDIFGDIAQKFKEGDIIGVIVEAFRGMLKTLATLVLDIPKNLLASAAEGLGFASFAKTLRDFSVSGLFGGTHTKTGGETQTDTKSVIGAAAVTTDAKNTAKAAAKAAKAAQGKADEDAEDAEDKESANPLLKLFGSDPFGDFNKALFENFNSTTNPAGAGITPATVENVGAKMSAWFNNTAEAKQDAAAQATILGGASTVNKTTVSTDNSSLIINSSNLPDRTALSLRPTWLFPGGH